MNHFNQFQRLTGSEAMHRQRLERVRSVVMKSGEIT